MTVPTDLRITGLRKSFEHTTVLDDVSLTLPAGRIVSVLGPSGSGKSTILNILTGGLEADAGAVLVGGVAPGRAERPFAFMPQRDVLLPWRRILANAAIGLEVAGMSRRRARERADRLFATFGIDGTQKLYPRQLSGGMRQRVSLLRTVVQEKPILLLDEPFGALDAITRDEMQQWLLQIWREAGWTILLITHDIREAVLLSDRVYVLSARPARVTAQVEVPRDIPRDEGFLLDPRVAALETRLHRALRGVIDEPSGKDFE